MIHQLNRRQFNNVRDLFSNLEENFLSTVSVFEGNIYGKIYVDKIEDPSAALLFLPNVRNFFLVGNEKNRLFNKDLSIFLYKDFFPRYTEQFKDKNFLVYCDDQYFDTINNIFSNLEKIETCFYEISDRKNFGMPEEIPKDYTVVKIDNKLIKRTDLINYQILPSWFKGTWDSQEHYLSRGFGYSAIYNDKEIACVVFCCYINEMKEKCELGVITFPEHRQRGLAKYATTVTIEHCYRKGINEIGWYCRDSNLASKKTAEAVGFKLQKKSYEFQGTWI